MATLVAPKLEYSLLGSIVAALATFTVTSAAHGQSLSLVDLGAGTSAYGINAAGQVTGCATTGAGASHAFLYSAGVMTDLGTLGGAGSCGYAINAGGQVTGYADTATAAHAFLYGNATMKDLGTVGGVPTSAGVSINAGGQVVGYTWPNAPFAPLQPPGLYGAGVQVALAPLPGMPTAHAFVYSQGTMTDLFASSSPESTPAFAFAINDGGEIAGDTVYGCGILCPIGSAFSQIGSTQAHLTDLPVQSGIFLTAVTGINTAGQIVAYGMDPDAYMHGVVYTNGVPLDLGNNTEAFAINSQGDVVGFKLGNSAIGLYTVIEKDMSPFIYSNGVKSALNLPGAIPTGINDSGWIIANHFTLGHAYLLEASNISLAPFGLSFGTIAFGQTTPPPTYECGACAVTLKNNTAASIPVTAFAIVGAFAQTNTCSGSLSPGASCVITVNFLPSALDIYLGALTVSAAGAQYVTLLRGASTITAHISSSSTAPVINEPFILTWSATAGSTCMGGGSGEFSGPVAVTGSMTITESTAATYAYTISCTQGSLSTQAQATVKVGTPKPGGNGGGSMGLTSVGVLLALSCLRRRHGAGATATSRT